MSENELISVCIPTYNNPFSLGRCLLSILNQSYKQFEVVITDDSSNDETNLLIANSFTDKRIRYYKNETCLGSPKNWNKALKKAKGEYIKIMHHDDWFSSNDALKEFYFALKTDALENSLIFSSGFNYYNTNYKPKKIKLHPGNNFLRKLKKKPSILLYSNNIGDPSMFFFSRKFNLYFDENTRWNVDVIFFSEFLKKNDGKFIHITKELLNITAGSPSQLTNTITNKEKFIETVYTFKKYTNIIEERKRLLFKVTFIALLKRYKITTVNQLIDYGLNVEEIGYFEKLLKISRLPISYKMFSLLKYLIINVFS